MDFQKILAELVYYARGMWRFRWHFLLVAWLIALPGWLIVYSMPDMYEARATVSVDTNSLLPTLTKGLTVNEDVMDDVALVSRAMLTRPNLEKVAKQSGLAERAQSPQELENLISMLQTTVNVQGGRDRIFRISYTDVDQVQATKVVATLLDAFVESSLGAQGSETDVTETALKLEIDDHVARLRKAEEALADFKKKNIGYMPNEGADYYSRLQAAMTKVNETDRKLRLLEQKRDEITRQLKGELPLLSAGTSDLAYANSDCSKADNLAQLNKQLSELQVDFTDKHPRIVKLKETIATLEEECRKERIALGGTSSAGGKDKAEADTNPVYQNLRLQLSNTDVELATLKEERQGYQNDVTKLRADVDKIADVETELKRLNRDYGVISSRHQELLRRWEALQSKRRLDPVTDKVQFNVLEPPFVNPRPVAPNRPLLLWAVLLFGLAAGAGAAFGLSQLRPVCFDRQSLARVTELPLLGGVSMIMSPGQISKRRLMTTIWAVGNLALIFVGGVSAVFAEKIAGLVQGLAGSILL